MESAKYIAVLLHCEKMRIVSKGGVYIFFCGINSCIARKKKKKKRKRKRRLPRTKMVKENWKCRTWWVTWREINTNGVFHSSNIVHTEVWVMERKVVSCHQDMLGLQCLGDNLVHVYRTGVHERKFSESTRSRDYCFRGDRKVTECYGRL